MLFAIKHRNTDVDNMDAITRETSLTTTQLMACGALYIYHSPRAVVIINYCKKLNSLKHLVRTTVAESHN